MNDDIKSAIIKIFHLENLDPERQNDLIERMGNLVFQASLMRAVDEMSDEDAQAFDELVDSNPKPEELFGFLSEKVPNISEIITEEVMNLKEESDKVVAMVQEDVAKSE